MNMPLNRADLVGTIKDLLEGYDDDLYPGFGANIADEVADAVIDLLDLDLPKAAELADDADALANPPAMS